MSFFKFRCPKSYTSNFYFLAGKSTNYSSLHEFGIKYNVNDDSLSKLNNSACSL